MLSVVKKEFFIDICLDFSVLKSNLAKISDGMLKQWAFQNNQSQNVPILKEEILNYCLQLPLWLVAWMS